MHTLPVFLRLADRPVLLIGSGEAARARRRLIERAGGRIVDGEDEIAQIAFIALDDGGQADAVAARLKGRGLLVNVTDRPDLCDFTMPAIVDRDPVIVAVGTGGASAGLAAALRQRIEALLPARLGDLACALRDAREQMRAAWPDPADRRRALAQALAPGGLADPFSSAPDVEEWLESGHARPSAELAHVRLRSLDPDDLTLREARLLAQADRIIHPADMPEAILARARADAVRIVGDHAGEGWRTSAGLTIILTVTPL